MKKLLLCLILFVITATAFDEIIDSTVSEDAVIDDTANTTQPENEKIAELFRKIDSLNVKFEVYKLEHEKKCEEETIKVPNMRKGVIIGTNLQLLHNPGVEIGYQLLSKRNFRFVTSLKAKYFTDIYDDEVYPPEYGLVFYLKETFGTPILFNFLSVSNYMAVALATEKSIRRYEFTPNRYYNVGFNLGMDVELWLTAKACLTFGPDMSLYYLKDGGATLTIHSNNWGIKYHF